MKSSLLKAVFVLGLASGLALALVPNEHGTLHNFLPVAICRWANENNDAENIIAFFVIAAVGLRLTVSQKNAGSSPAAAVLQFLERPLARVAALMLLVCAIEFAQLFIPGRSPELQDVCTGWSGILAAWLCSVLLDARGTRSARAESVGN